ncbi:phage antirepressor N-terminal domain-containing protein [Brevibacillus laterosporus]|uniref:phage antirepressor N-terminal domain-containing protein n=1 Tax=Brevibacillus laterosporus TaxID=1465 RepID=UPI0018CECE41|nr:phage antirepressor N-terminal domain-containing protein [Brevibacillus laterosporus]MBG9788515.1 hypothetical protein [Brevibacillus laterosporus]
MNIVPVDQKLVNFNGAEILGVKANDGKVYVGVRWVCEGIGLTEGQIKSERKKIQDDVVLKQGGRNLILPTNGGNQEILTIELDFLPLWLAKISITPTMQNAQPEVTECLIEYQLKAKEVLAQAFLNQRPQTQLEVLQGAINQMVEQEKRLSLVEYRMDAAEKRQEHIKEVLSLHPTEWRSKTTSMLNKISFARGGEGAFQAVRKESYDKLEERAKCKLSVRVTNIKKRMALEGIAKSKIDKVNNLDAIAEDARLTEIYLAIVKEMAIQYKVDGEIA